MVTWSDLAAREPGNVVFSWAHLKLSYWWWREWILSNDKQFVLHFGLQYKCLHQKFRHVGVNIKRWLLLVCVIRIILSIFSGLMCIRTYRAPKCAWLWPPFLEKIVFEKHTFFISFNKYWSTVVCHALCQPLPVSGTYISHIYLITTSSTPRRP